MDDHADFGFPFVCKVVHGIEDLLLGVRSLGHSGDIRNRPPSEIWTCEACLSVFLQRGDPAHRPPTSSNSVVRLFRMLADRRVDNRLRPFYGLDRPRLGLIRFFGGGSAMRIPSVARNCLSSPVPCRGTWRTGMPLSHPLTGWD